MTFIKLNIEKIVLVLLSISFFIGIWYAFPLLDIVGDEMYYVGGVLRAMEHHTIIPAVDEVPYGTLTYLLNYFLSAFILSFLLPFFKFSISSLKLFLVSNQWVMYFSLRFLNAMLSMVMLFVVNNFFKKEFEDVKVRLLLLVLLFTNIIVGVILHTGKMWVLSVLLVIISFHYLNQSLTKSDNYISPNKDILLTILFGFLAVSNFPLNLFCLVNIPILIFFFRSRRNTLLKIFYYVCIGSVVYLVITFFNFESIKTQIASIFIGYHPVNNDFIGELNFGESFLVYVNKFIIMFPLLTLTLLVSIRNGVRNRKLLIISFIYLVVYFLAVTVIANWSTDPRVDLRYLFPLCFFFIFFISSFNIKFTTHFYFIGAVSVIYYVTVLYYLAIPSTYNQAFRWINSNLGDKNVIITNTLPKLRLIKNKESYLSVRDESCSTECKNVIQYDLHKNFKPLIFDFVTRHTDWFKRKLPQYYISELELSGDNLDEVVHFTNPSMFSHSVEYNVGSYFDRTFFKLNNFGPDIFIYKYKDSKTGNI